MNPYVWMLLGASHNIYIWNQCILGNYSRKRHHTFKSSKLWSIFQAIFVHYCKVFLKEDVKHTPTLTHSHLQARSIPHPNTQTNYVYFIYKINLYWKIKKETHINSNNIIYNEDTRYIVPKKGNINENHL